MKKLLLSALVIASSVTMSAQKVNAPALKADINKMKVESVASRTAKMSRLDVKTAATVKSQSLLNSQFGKKSLLKEDTTAKELFYSGPDAMLYVDGYLVAYLPAYCNATWNNRSMGYTTEDPFTWTQVYATDDAGNVTDSEIVEDVHGTFYQGPAFIDAPILSSGDESYQLSDETLQGTIKPYGIIYGYTPDALELTEYEFNIFNPSVEVKLGQFRAYLCDQNADTKASAQAYWEELFEEQGISGTTCTIKGIGNAVPKPASPYILQNVTMYAWMESAANAELTLKISKMELNEEGYYERGEVLSTSNYTIDHAVEFAYPEPLTFPIIATDENGMESDRLVVDYPIMIELTGFDGESEFTYFRPCPIYYYDDYISKTNEFFGFVTLDVDYNGTTFTDFDVFMPESQYYYVEDVDGDNTYTEGTDKLFMPNQFYMALDAYYPFLGFHDWDTGEILKDEVLVIEMPAEGGEKSIVCQAYNEDIETWTVADSEGNDVPAWTGLEVGYATAQSTDDSGSTSTFQLPALYFAVEALAQGAAARETTIKIDADGAKRTIIVRQHDANSVAAVAANAVKVATVGDNFEVTATAGVSSVNVYNVAGQLVKTATLEAGVNVVNAADLAKGVYVLKFNNNYTVKAVK